MKIKQTKKLTETLAVPASFYTVSNYLATSAFFKTIHSINPLIIKNTHLYIIMKVCSLLFMRDYYGKKKRSKEKTDKLICITDYISVHIDGN